MKYKNFLTQTDHGLMLVNKNDRVVGRHLTVNGGWERKYIDFIQRLIADRFREVDTVDIVDGGSNVGAYALSLAGLAKPRVRIHAIEVQRLVFQMLNANVALNSLENVWTYHAALSEKAGEIALRFPDLNHGANFGAFEIRQDIRNSDFDGKVFTAPEKVRTLAIDDLNLAHCAFIKLDVEGMEHLAIQGGLATIGRSRPILFFERHKTDYEAIQRALAQHGYVLWELPEFNVLAVRREWELNIPNQRRLDLA